MVEKGLMEGNPWEYTHNIIQSRAGKECGNTQNRVEREDEEESEVFYSLWVTIGAVDAFDC